ncbi:MAG: four-helix bundle copper-binding protein [Actinobacteria bacterium]|nr:four-helix bundle copper-binding protein [Actinomycetota bacterium]
MPHATAMGSGTQAALDCHTVCLETVTHCLTKGGDHARPDHIVLLLDCAEICQTAANFMTRDSELHGLTCRVCAEICESCAQSCEQLGDDDEMRRCAEACRRCAESCRAMAA